MCACACVHQIIYVNKYVKSLITVAFISFFFFSRTKVNIKRKRETCLITNNLLMLYIYIIYIYISTRFLFRLESSQTTCKECIMYTKHATLQHTCSTCNVNVVEFNYRGFVMTILDMLYLFCVPKVYRCALCEWKRRAIRLYRYTRRYVRVSEYSSLTSERLYLQKDIFGARISISASLAMTDCFFYVLFCRD